MNLNPIAAGVVYQVMKVSIPIRDLMNLNLEAAAVLIDKEFVSIPIRDLMNLNHKASPASRLDTTCFNPY